MEGHIHCLGAHLVISVPAVIIAALKLRKRNLGPLLDANGWAVNAKARINIPFGASLTEVAMLPPGSQRDLTDPFAESHAGRNKFIVLLVVLGILWSMWYFGCVLKYLPQGLQDALPKSGYVLRKEKREADAKAKAVAAALRPPHQPASAPPPAPVPPSAPAARSWDAVDHSAPRTGCLPPARPRVSCRSEQCCFSRERGPFSSETS